jgi:hypothetical protein
MDSLGESVVGHQEWQLLSHVDRVEVAIDKLGLMITPGAIERMADAIRGGRAQNGELESGQLFC